MFVAIYEFDVKDGMENQFVEAWLSVTREIYKQCGSYGSRLQKDKNGIYIGYAQWPDRETWTKDWSPDPQVSGERANMRACLNSVLTVYEAEVVADYLQQHTHKG